MSADVINSGAGDDFIAGYGNHDILTGGAGRDVFAYGGGADTIALADIITDFQDGIDKIGLDRLKFSDLTIFNVGQNCVISVTETHEFLVVVNNAAGLIDANDFVNVDTSF